MLHSLLTTFWVYASPSKGGVDGRLTHAPDLPH
jgi:hypothetical protein